MLRMRFVLIAILALSAGAGSCSLAATIVQVAAGDYHTVVLKSDGTVWAWGDNSYGELGDGTTMPRPAPVQVSGLTGVTAIAAGCQHTVALKSDGTVWAWGDNYYGELGDGTTTQRLTPVQVPGLTGVTAIAAGSGHTVALKTDGTVWAWGLNYYGQLGDGTTTDKPTPVQVSGLTGVTAIGGGGNYDRVVERCCDHTVALKTDGTVWAWGYNGDGGLGDGTTTNRSTPVRVSGLTGMTAIAAGWFHTIALKSDGTVWAWGNNGEGQVGDGTGTGRLTPVQVTGLTGVTAIAAGGWHTVALRSDGTVWAWGYNYDGELGDGTTAWSRLIPVEVSGLAGAAAIAAGGYHTVALKSDGTLWAWGSNGSGELGDGTRWDSFAPVRVSGLTGATAIATGYFHTVALKGDGTLWAWGENSCGELGDGTTTPRPAPVQVFGLAGISAIAAGSHHTVALKSDGTVWAWGWNYYGQLGDGSTTDKSTPVQVPGLTGVTAIAAGGYHTVALKTDGTVWVWGDNEYGQLGDGTTTNKSTPVQVFGLAGISAIAAGSDHTVALKNDGTVWAWGYNCYGQLGDGTATERHTPVQVSGLTAVTAIAAGGDHAVALKSDGTVRAWGDNWCGELGNGTRNDSSTPVEPWGLTGVTAIAAGYAHTVALKTDGTVCAWGFNQYGELGAVTTNWCWLTPVQVSGLTGATAIAGGDRHTVALRADGTVVAWGDDEYGELGDGHSDINPLPKQVVWPDLLPPTGTITINGGAAYTNSATVTLSLPATDDSGTVAQMRISNDGVFDTEPWQPYAASTSWDLDPGDGPKTVYVEFMDPTGNVSDVASASIMLDSTYPGISSVTVDPKMAAAGDYVTVSVSVTGAGGVDHVTANGAALTQSLPGTWTGRLTATGPNGVKTVTAIATDHLSRSVSLSTSYKVTQVVGTSCKGANAAVSAMCDNFLFKLWGKVTIDVDSFWLDDGSPKRVKVIAPGYGGIADGNVATARGILDTTGDPVTLTCPSGLVVKEH